ncbi:MAG: hypothetical protein MO846_01735 [Candidatus Devosia symbiotica]|nr:hypothetical protein [Candidatus Devosia symbiotica]
MNDQSGRRALLLLQDHTSAIESTQTASHLAAKCVFLEDLTVEHLDNDPNLIIDVDLSEVRKVR